MSTAPAPDLLELSELPTLGLSRRQLAGLLDEGAYERIGPGQYLRAGAADDTTAAWMAIASKRPEATLCLLTAASLHDLTDEIPSRSHIAVPRGRKTIAAYLAPISWHSFDPETFEIGRLEHQLPGGRTIGLYSPERTIIDLFRLRHEWGNDLAIEALKRWLRTSGGSPSALLTQATAFPKAKPALRHALEILL